MHPTFLQVLTHWSLEPSVVAGLVALTGGYAWLQRQAPFKVSRGRQACFYWAIALLALALLSPLDELSDRYFLTAHMIQHLLLVLLVAPLIVRAMPPEWAERIRIHPLVAFGLFNLVFTLTHLPLWYNATLLHEPLHVVEHVAYIATAILNWLPIASPAVERRLKEPLQMLYLFAETLPMFLVGSLLALSTSVVYPFYLRAPRLLPYTPVEDQSMAGLLMWIGTAFFYLGACTLVFFRWAHKELDPDTSLALEDSWQATA